MKKQLLSFILLTSCLTTSVYADEPNNIYRVGAIALWGSELYQGEGSETRLLPALYLKSGRWEFNFKELKYHLIDTEQFSLAPLLSFDLNGYDADDSPALAGMEDRDFSIGLGLAAKVKLGLFDIDASVQQDIANNSDGLTADLSLGMTRPVTKQLIAGFKVGAAYQDSDYSNYYYGVQSNEVRESRPAYELDNTINPYAQLNAIYRLNKSWSLNTAIIYTQLDSEIEDSPIVEHGNETTFLLGITYQGFF
ncbi:MipA/OmpV family protein [Candidatus Albibeggiatoa sp. nov. NOAA]|uniref:MipA/OmpV family protein n=1 Tax=Candidatus Albibeggiatoa sp. nov. NOAA TaxID=3162724 RepID=UPI0032FE2076|nr:MipA/OmpV family protein [Thiotrichaceae bacterium]